jgi:UDP-N-acetyl-alpha-D-muramoyl-L-alanyl-L-glutamate epimerase
MAADAKQSPTLFDPTAFQAFRFVSRDLDAGGHVTLRYALDEEIFFVEELDLPVEGGVREADSELVAGLLSLLHWVAGVSYYKVALPPKVSCETGLPTPAVAALLEALYSEGLAELAYTNALPGLPRPSFPSEPGPGAAGGGRAAEDRRALERVLVPVGGGKDSAVALEIVRCSLWAMLLRSRVRWRWRGCPICWRGAPWILGWRR